MQFKVTINYGGIALIRIITEHGFPTSIYRYAMDLNKSLPESQVILLLTRPDIYKNKDNLVCYQGFEHFGILNKYFNYLSWGIAFRDLWKYLRSEDDIVHYITPSINPVFFNDESIITMHDNPRTLLSTMYIKSAMRKRTMKTYIDKYKNFSHIIATSNYVKESLIDYGFESKIEVIFSPVSDFSHLSTDKSILRSKLNLPLDKKLVLSVSTLQQRKNLFILPKIMNKLGDGFQLIRVGEPIGNSISFSHVDSITLNEIYNACDVLILPSLEEGFGYPIVEAMTVGLPVAANNFITAKEIGKEAVIICDNSVDSFADGIIQAIDESERLVKRGFLRAGDFTMDKFQANIRRFYRSIR